jgi:WD40 repeat protein
VGCFLVIACLAAAVQPWRAVAQVSRVSDANGAKDEGALTKLPDHVETVVWSPDGKRFASIAIRKTPPEGNETFTRRFDRFTTLRIHDAETGKELNSLGELKNPLYMDCTFSPDGRLLAISRQVLGGRNDCVEIWDAETTRLRAEVTIDDTGVVELALAFSPDSRMFAIAYGKHADGWTRKGARLFTAPSGRELITLAQAGSIARSVAFSPDGKLIACGGYDGKIPLWKPDVAKPIRTLEGAKGSAAALAFSPDGRVLACATTKGGIQLWDVADGKAKSSPDENPSRCAQVVFSPDGTLLAGTTPTGAAEGIGLFPIDREVRVWNAKSGKLLMTIPDASDSIAFSPGGRILHAMIPGKGIRHIDLSSVREE